MRPAFLLPIMALALAASAASPQDAQDAPLCSDRPGMATPSCVVGKGTVQVETSVADWSHDISGGTRSDTVLFADTLLKYGVGGDTEVRVSFTPYVRSRTRGAAGGVSIADGFGDVGVSARHRVASGRVSVAVQPFVTLPVGADAVSAGTWSGGATVPVDVSLPAGWSLNATPTVAAAADDDGDGDGRHLAYSTVVALSHGLGANLAATGEIFVQRDRDPAGHSTRSTADLVLAWQPIAGWQFDVGTYVGLNRTTTDVELLGGFTRRF